jgi:transcriptional regulator with XRE-family HTH domain
MAPNTATRAPQFARWLRYELRRQGLEAAQLAEALRIPRLTIHAWLMGDLVPSRASCARLAQFLEAPEAAVLRLAGWPARGS